MHAVPIVIRRAGARRSGEPKIFRKDLQCSRARSGRAVPTCNSATSTLRDEHCAIKARAMAGSLGKAREVTGSLGKAREVAGSLGRARVAPERNCAEREEEEDEDFKVESAM